MPETFTYTLTEGEANVVLAALQEVAMPYRVTAPVISKLIAQGQMQIATAAARSEALAGGEPAAEAELPAKPDGRRSARLKSPARVEGF